MTQLKPTRTVYTVGQFLNWQRAGALQLKPVFQRNAVWRPKAKSYLIDTVARGLPIPIVFLRIVQDLESLTSRQEVVDGQQRLRTLFAFIDPSVLPDYDEPKDKFTVTKSHNADLAGKTFRQLAKSAQAEILGYEISTHVFPASTGDDVVLRIFARINSTGSDLNQQELRNAKFFGAFKTLAYNLAFQHLAQWRRWEIYTDNEIARMEEVEGVSEHLMAMMGGIDAKSHTTIDRHYETFDDELPGTEQLEGRFSAVMEAIDQSVGDLLANSRLRRQALFFSLFTAVYDHMYGFSSYTRRQKARKLPNRFRNAFEKLDERVASGELPENIQDAMSRATADRARRDTRHKFFLKALGLESAS